MVREAYHTSTYGVTLSSIALLQERFRQLQKMKELRQEKELIRILSESDSYYPPVHPKTFSGSKLAFGIPDPHCQLNLSLWPSSEMKKQENLKRIESPLNDVHKSWFADAPKLTFGSPVKVEHCDSDIDTSLRL